MRTQTPDTETGAIYPGAQPGLEEDPVFPNFQENSVFYQLDNCDDFRLSLRMYTGILDMPRTGRCSRCCVGPSPMGTSSPWRRSADARPATP